MTPKMIEASRIEAAQTEMKEAYSFWANGMNYTPSADTEETIRACLRFTLAALGDVSDTIAKTGIAAFNSVPIDDIHNTRAIKAEFIAMIAALAEQVERGERG